MNRPLRPVLVLIGASALACSSVKSDDVLTDAMWADLWVTSSAVGEGSTASAILRVGGADSNTFVNLEGGDFLEVSDAVGTYEMSEVALGDLYSYTAALDAEVEGDEFHFALVRDVDDGAPDSSGSMPAPFELTAPLDNPEWHPAVEPITVTWDSAGTNDAIQLSVVSDCALTYIVDVSGDPGTYTIESGAVTVTAEAGTECSSYVQVQRRRAGDLDPGYGEGGTIYGIQERRADVRLIP